MAVVLLGAFVACLVLASPPGCKDRGKRMRQYPYFINTLDRRWKIVRESFQSSEPNIGFAPVLLKDLTGALEAMDDNYKAGNRDEAIRWLKRGLEANPGQVGLLWMLGLLFVEAGEVEKAEETKRQLVEAEYSDVLIRYLDARIELSQGHWLDARQRLERIRAETPEEHQRIERWVERGIRQFVMARARSSQLDLVLCDEGIAHRSITLFVSPRPELERARLRSFLRCWALPDLVVQVRAGLDRCAERTRSRGVPKRLEGKGDAALRAFVEASATVSDEIAREARRRGLPTLEIDNEHASAEEFLASPQSASLLDQLLH